MERRSHEPLNELFARIAAADIVIGDKPSICGVRNMGPRPDHDPGFKQILAIPV